jgi:hypothetical protein
MPARIWYWANLLRHTDSALASQLTLLSSNGHVLGRQQRSTYTNVRLALLAPSGLVWLATWPSTQNGLAALAGTQNLLEWPA